MPVRAAADTAVSGRVLAARSVTLPGQMVGWAAGRAVRRSLGPASLTGICVALSACAAAWLSAGTRAGSLSGALALCACCLTAVIGSRLAAMLPARQPAFAAAPARSLAVRGSMLSELVVYAGLAAGAARHWADAWQLAAAAASALAVAGTLAGCAGPEASRGAASPRGVASQRRAARLRAAGRLAGALGRAVPTASAARLLLVAITASVWSGRDALLAVLGLLVVAIVLTACSPGPVSRGIRDSGPGSAAAGSALRAWRDDGPAALCIGRAVRGSLVPLPPALLGLAAAAVAAGLGLGSLPPVLVLTPLAVALLAAPGASHPHTGRLDWLVPSVLLACELLYIAALGFQTGVPGPVVLAVCGLIALCRAGVTDPARSGGQAGQGGWPRRARGAGWEGRMLWAGLGTAFAIPALAYLALAAYLGVLACLDAMAVASGEGEHR
jgi:hypothetical protein